MRVKARPQEREHEALPTLYIMLLTYTDDPDGPRAQYAHKTLRSVLDHLHYSGQISVHIADDGSPSSHIDRLRELAGVYSRVQGVTSTNAQRRGYGASYNLATQVIHTSGALVLPLEDDWELVHDLDLDHYARALLTCKPKIGCIRLGYLGYTQELRGSLEICAERQFLLFDSNSSERHVSAGHPRLETIEWEREVGPWAEGLDPGATEFEWCGRASARHGVAWPMDTPSGGWFAHIGTVQARADQLEAGS